jgi:putative exosortase-associated protein (TIGR04073 family)
MRKLILPLAAVAVALFVAGCQGPEQKLGRGLANTAEVVRWGELRSSVQQYTVEPIPGTGYYGFVHGFDKSVARTGMGIFETVTFPIPTPDYKPMWTSYLSPDPAMPNIDTDYYTGFSGNSILGSWFPLLNFQVFPNQ